MRCDLFDEGGVGLAPGGTQARGEAPPHALERGFGLAAIGTLIVHVRLAFVGQKERRLAIARNSAMENVGAQHVRRPETERGGHINARLGVVKDDLFPPRRQSEITEVTAVKQA